MSKGIPTQRTDLGMYDGKSFNGKTLLEWREHFHNEYSLGEIYQMAIDGKLSALMKD